jgi:hypothetical protein
MLILHEGLKLDPLLAQDSLGGNDHIDNFDNIKDWWVDFIHTHRTRRKSSRPYAHLLGNLD